MNAIPFSSTAWPFAKGPVPATPENRADLRKFVEGCAARGATNIEAALHAVTSAPAEEGRVRTVVFLTDGRPTVGSLKGAELVKIAREGGKQGLRIYTSGVGDDVDAGLLRGIARAGRGQADMFRPGGEIESHLTSFLDRTSTPDLADLRLTVDGVSAADFYPRPLPDARSGPGFSLPRAFPVRRPARTSGR